MVNMGDQSKNSNVNFKVIDYNWLKGEYMKKPEEMDKTGDECWFNRFYKMTFTYTSFGQTSFITICLAR